MRARRRNGLPAGPPAAISCAEVEHDPTLPTDPSPNRRDAGPAMTVAHAQLSLRQTNRLRVLETLYRHPGTSRAEVARRTGLSRATVSTLVEELQRAGVVEERDVADDGRPRNTGRPPILLSLVSAAAYAGGLDV